MVQRWESPLQKAKEGAGLFRDADLADQIGHMGSCPFY